jgi:hypothetical protein
MTGLFDARAAAAAVAGEPFFPLCPAVDVVAEALGAAAETVRDPSVQL